MGTRRLRRLLAAYGADPQRWPESDEQAALLQATAAADERHQAAAALDAALDRLAPPPADPALIDRIVARAVAMEQERPRPRIAPRLPVGAWLQRSGVTWPQLTALAAAAGIGLAVGWADPWITDPPPAAEEVVLLSMLDGLD